MRNPDKWQPTKVSRMQHGFGPSFNPANLGVSSRLVASCQIRHYDRALQQHASGHLLDLGCGNVPYFEVYKDLVDQVTCVDWENSLHKNEFVDYFMDLNRPLAFESESFDTVLLTDVLEHIYRPVQLLSEGARVLRRGGYLILGVPFFYWLHERPFDFYRYTEFALRQMCADSSLEIRSLQAYGGAPEILADVLGKCMASSKLSLACGVYTAFCRRLIDFEPIRRLSQKSSKVFPLGYTLVAQRT